MCQLNIFLVPKEVKENKVLSMMKDVFGYEVAENIDSEKPLKKDGYSFYISGGMRCNCGSLPCKYQEEDNSLSFDETVEKLIKNEKDRLVKIRDFMEQKDYAKKRSEFDKLLKKYSKDMQAAFNDAGKIERKLTDKIMKDKTLSDEEKSKKLHEEVYPKVNELLSQTDKDFRVKAYHDFIKENSLMWGSYMLTLKRSKPKKEKAIPLKKDKVEKEEIIEIEIPSFCIYDMIDEVDKKFNKKGMEGEFFEIKEFAKKVLEQTDKIALVSFWQDGEEFIVNNEKSVKFADFKIEDLAYLKYGEILTIEK